MKKVLFIILSLCIMQTAFAELVAPGADVNKWIGASDVKYNADGSMGVGDVKYNKNGATGWDGLVVDKDNARAGTLVASGGMTPALTPLKATPVSGTATPTGGTPTIAGSSTASGWSGAVAGGLVVWEKLPQTGPKEILIVLIASILAAIIFYRNYRKSSI